jgi:hypothetical protein
MPSERRIRGDVGGDSETGVVDVMSLRGNVGDAHSATRKMRPNKPLRMSLWRVLAAEAVELPGRGGGGCVDLKFEAGQSASSAAPEIRRPP